MAITAYARNIFSGHKFKIRSYMMAPSVYAGNSTVGTISVYPTLYLAYEPSRTEIGTMKNFRPKDAQFKVNPRNFKRVLEFFRGIYTWFNSDQYNDLFILDEHTGKLMINMEYRETTLLLKPTRYEAQALLAIPTVVDVDAMNAEGCALAINQRKFACALSDIEVESILGILENFSFQAEAQLLMQIGSNEKYFSDKPPFDGRSSQGGNTHKVVW